MAPLAIYLPSYTEFNFTKEVETSVGSMARVEDIEISCALASGATQPAQSTEAKQSNCSEAATAMGFGMRADVAAEARGERRRQG